MVLADLSKELIGSEGEAWHNVTLLRFGEPRLVRLLESDEPSHQVIDVDHGDPHVGIDWADVSAAGRQAVLGLLVRRGEKRIERVLCGPIAPHRIVVQHTRQHGKTRVTAVVAHKLRHEISTGFLLPSVVGARVLVWVLVQPARSRTGAWGGGAEGSDRVGKADAAGPDLSHRTEHILHPTHRHCFGHRRVQCCLH
eukprot:3985743-Prymnesium_polylepis.1